MAIVATIIDVFWLFSVLALLLLIWLTNVRHIHRMEVTMFEAAQKSAEAAVQAAEAVTRTVAVLERAVKDVP